MYFLKAIYHFNAFLKRLFLKIIFGAQLCIGKKTTWRKGFSISLTKNAKIKIGTGCFFNNFCSINAMKLVSIGDNTIIGENVKIYDHNHRFKQPQKIKDQGYSIGEVLVGSNCWIGSNVTLLKGAIIHDNCVIGANCVIDSEIAEGSIVRSKSSISIEKINYSNEKV